MDGVTARTPALTARWLHEPARTLAGPVLATGVFDLLHIGHTRFLSFARAAGDGLLIGVESDARVAYRKGGARPVVPAQERGELLAALAAVDGVFLVDGPPRLISAAAYAALLEPLGPASLALTAGDPAEPGKREAARRLGIGVVVAPLLVGWSTTDLIERGAYAVGA
jgi:cytidyltransferase-like protein